MKHRNRTIDTYHYTNLCIYVYIIHESEEEKWDLGTPPPAKTRENLL